LNTFLSSGSGSSAASKSSTAKKPATKKSASPLGDLGNLTGALGGLLGKK
jgi:hypothetical protein